MTAPVAGSKYYYHYDTQSQTEDGNDRAPSFVPSVVLNDRRVTISSDRASSFRKQVQDRDQKCVISGSGEAFEIAHLIPHFKGNQIIQALSEYRSTLETQVMSIDDARNGILLVGPLHIALAKSKICFLPLPNFTQADVTLRLDDLAPDCTYEIDSYTTGLPAVFLLTAPDIADVYRWCKAEQGQPCSLYPGRSCSVDESELPYPEIWVLDILLGFFFQTNFATSDGAEWLARQTQQRHSELEEISRRAQDQISPERNHSAPSTPSPEPTPKRSKMSGNKPSERLDRLGKPLNWDPWDYVLFNPATAFRNRQHNMQQLKQAQREAEELDKQSQRRAASWVAEQTRNAE